MLFRNLFFLIYFFILKNVVVTSVVEPNTLNLGSGSWILIWILNFGRDPDQGLCYKFWMKNVKIIEAIFYTLWTNGTGRNFRTHKGPEYGSKLDPDPQHLNLMHFLCNNCGNVLWWVITDNSGSMHHKCMTSCVGEPHRQAQHGAALRGAGLWGGQAVPQEDIPWAAGLQGVSASLSSEDQVSTVKEGNSTTTSIVMDSNTFNLDPDSRVICNLCYKFWKMFWKNNGASLGGIKFSWNKIFLFNFQKIIK